MKKFFWSFMLVSAVIMGCQKNDGRKPDPQPDPQPGPVDPVDPGKEAECDWADYLIGKEYTCETTAQYGIAEEVYSTMTHKDGKKIFELLGFDSWAEMVEAMGTIEGSPETGEEVLYMGNDPATGYDMTDAFNTNGIGYWCNGQGSKQNWGDDARIYSEAFFDEEGELAVTIGVMPGVMKGGDVYTARMVFQRTESADNIIRVGIEYKVKVTEFVDPEAGKYNSANRKTGEFTMNDVILTVPVNVFYDGVQADVSGIQEYLQLTKYEIVNLGKGTYDDDDPTVLLKGLDVSNYVGGERVAANAGGLGGNWMKTVNEVGAWGVESGAWFIELQASIDAIAISVGTMPGDEGAITELVAALVGQTAEYTQVITYIPDFGEAPTIINLNYKVNFVAAAD